MLPNMFLACIRLIFRGSFVEITTAILLVYKILKMPLDMHIFDSYYSCKKGDRMSCQFFGMLHHCTSMFSDILRESYARC
jgi:hypothetical protein